MTSTLRQSCGEGCIMLKKTENQKLPPRFRKVIEAFHSAVSKSPLGFKGVAAELGKSLSQLYDECNAAPAKTTAGKLGVEDAIGILRITNDLEPLRAIAAELGCRVQRQARAPDATKSAVDYFIALDLAVLTFKQLSGAKASYNELVPAMRDIQDAMEDLCILAKANDENISPEMAAWSAPMYRRSSPAKTDDETQKPSKPQRSWLPWRKNR